MFSLQIRRYSVSKLINEVFKIVKKCKIYQNKGSLGSLASWDLTKIFAGGGQNWQFSNVCPGGW